jgi:hypothetical protein
MTPSLLPNNCVVSAESAGAEPPVSSPFLDALPPSLLRQLEQVMASPELDLQRRALSSVHRATPTEENSCSCATCGSTCCVLV